MAEKETEIQQSQAKTLGPDIYQISIYGITVDNDPQTFLFKDRDYLPMLVGYNFYNHISIDQLKSFNWNGQRSIGEKIQDLLSSHGIQTPDNQEITINIKTLADPGNQDHDVDINTQITNISDENESVLVVIKPEDSEFESSDNFVIPPGQSKVCGNHKQNKSDIVVIDIRYSLNQHNPSEASSIQKNLKSIVVTFAQKAFISEKINPENYERMGIIINSLRDTHIESVKAFGKKYGLELELPDLVLSSERDRYLAQYLNLYLNPPSAPIVPADSNTSLNPFLNEFYKKILSFVPYKLDMALLKNKTDFLEMVLFYGHSDQIKSSIYLSGRSKLRIYIWPTTHKVFNPESFAQKINNEYKAEICKVAINAPEYNFNKLCLTMNLELLNQNMDKLISNAKALLNDATIIQ